MDEPDNRTMLEPAARGDLLRAAHGATAVTAQAAAEEARLTLPRRHGRGGRPRDLSAVHARIAVTEQHSRVHYPDRSATKTMDRLAATVVNAVDWHRRRLR